MIRILFVCHGNICRPATQRDDWERIRNEYEKTACGRSFCVSNKLFGDTIPLQPHGDRVVDP